MEKYKCCFCGKVFIGWGNNPEPVKSGKSRCCNDCNATIVLPARLKELMEGKKK